MFFNIVNQMFGSNTPASDYYYQVGGNKIISSDNETVLGSSRKLGGAAKHLNDSSKKHIILPIALWILESACNCYWKAQ